ncbi:MAG: flagellar hook protein FlgE [Acidobacteriia bacterium]|nr:flagellar hook protein FlgE [Terriglobia bacterium]
MPSFSIPLSGLNSDSQALSAIANNLANLNTVGYKATRPLFRDLYYQQVGTTGGGDPIQVGAGTALASNGSVFTQGSKDNTGVPTDVAIQGDGFFAVQKDGMQLFTRAGNFSQGPDGALVATDGSNVLGYSAANGVIDPNQPVGPITIARGQVTPANATTTVQLGMNLDSNAAIGDTFSTPSPMYDSLGAQHVLTFNFTKTAANAWDYNVSIPAADVGTTGPPVVVSSGSLGFDGTGTLVSPPADVTGVNITGLADGANDASMTWTLFSAGVPVVTQMAAPSAAANSHQDGYPSGSLLDFNIGSDGVIEGNFSNGQTRAIGQIAIASFANPEGLMSTGSNSFQETLASGTASIGAPDSGGRGSLVGGCLELSTADIAHEFAQLILAQRGYQANAKVVTAFDEITQDTINLKR